MDSLKWAESPGTLSLSLFSPPPCPTLPLLAQSKAAHWSLFPLKHTEQTQLRHLQFPYLDLFFQNLDTFICYFYLVSLLRKTFSIHSSKISAFSHYPCILPQCCLYKMLLFTLNTSLFVHPQVPSLDFKNHRAVAWSFFCFPGETLVPWTQNYICATKSQIRT